MKYVRRAKGAHPGIEKLALYASGDVALLEGWRLKRHLAGCAACDQCVSMFRGTKSELKREAAAETLTGFEAIVDWSRLEREMLGNIGVGVAAARCVDKVRSGRLLAVRSAIAAALVALFVASWMMHVPREQTDHIVATLKQFAGFDRQGQIGTVVETTPEGIAVRARGITLTLLHPPAAMVSMSGSSAVEARYVDEDTGQVTIANVYGQ